MSMVGAIRGLGRRPTRRMTLLARMLPAFLCLLALGPLAGQGGGEDAFSARRKAMVEEQVAARGVRDARVLAAMSAVPRQRFVPAELREEAYGDYPLPIGEGQTISQPYIVALMTESAAIRAGEKVLEVGTGSGYQAAVLSRLAGAVFSIEIDALLARRAAATLAELGCSNVKVRSGDGFFGWPEEAPFDAILITCAVDRVPPKLFDQLAEGGRLVLPLGDPRSYQILTVVTKKGGKPVSRRLIDVRFVPMTGQVQKIKEEPSPRSLPSR